MRSAVNDDAAVPAGRSPTPAAFAAVRQDRLAEGPARPVAKVQPASDEHPVVVLGGVPCSAGHRRVPAGDVAAVPRAQPQRSSIVSTGAAHGGVTALAGVVGEAAEAGHALGQDLRARRGIEP